MIIFFQIKILDLHAEPLKLNIKAEAGILINADTGAMLYEKNSKKSYYPASITKVATALYTLKLKRDCLDEIITAEKEELVTMTEEAKRGSNYSMPAYWLVTDGTHISLKKDEKMPLRDLLYGMMLASGNDASNVIARFVSGSVPNFMVGLNNYLKEINCLNTNFCNPHGLFHPKHQTTAYDMALIAKEALKDPIFCKIVSTPRYHYSQTNKREAGTFVQSNKLLKKGDHFYSKAIGIKTGYISKAENTFVAAARYENRTLIAVLLKTKQRNDSFSDSVRLFEEAFNQSLVQKVLLKKGLQKFTLEFPDGKETIKTYSKNDLKISYYPAEEPLYKSYLQWKKIIPPVYKGQEVGEIKIQNEAGVILASLPLFSQNDVDETWNFWISRKLQSIKSNYFAISLWAVGFISIVFIYVMLVKHRKYR
jgi:serine-type D-Ala-D-Ala carboxypeptidase (penicillin-binding protein 5/6)